MFKGNEYRVSVVNAVLAFLIAASLAFVPFTQAFPESRQTDIICGGSVSDRGLLAAYQPDVAANKAFVLDSDGNVYFERDADAPAQIASITKIMTAIVALDNASLSDEVVISKAAAEIGESSAALQEGDRLTLEEALKGLMIPSGNDAAQAIAESVGATILDNAEKAGKTLKRRDGSEIKKSDENAAYDAFVATMNQKAAEIGMSNSVFTNPHGLDFDNFEGELHSTARDVATMSQYALRFETFRNIVSTPNANISVKRDGQTVSLPVESTDTMLETYDGACGIKTGFTEKAGACFSGACFRDGKYFVGVVLDSPDNQQRFVDTTNLFDWLKNNTVDYKLANSDKTVKMNTATIQGDVPVIAEASLSDWMDKTVPVTLANPNETVKTSALFGNVSQDIVINNINGSHKAGDTVGKAYFYQQNKLLKSMDVVLCEDVEAPNILEMAQIGLSRLGNVFSGGKNTADTVIYNQTPLILKKA